MTMVLKRKPNSMRALFGRGRAYALTGKYRKSLADLTELIRVRSDWPPGYELRAYVYRKLGEDAKAKEDEKRARELRDKLRSAEKPPESP